MSDKPYTVELGESYDSLATIQVQYYCEVSYRNVSRTNLAIVEFNGKINDLPPECTGMIMGGSEQVIIQFRSISGRPIDTKNNPVLMKGYTIKIPMELILNNYQIYIEELNVVICLKANTGNVCHPYASVNYGRAMQDVLGDIRNHKDSMPYVQFAINDPFHKLGQDVLYGIMYNEVVEIPVTQSLSQEGICALYAMMSVNGDRCTYYESLEPMVDEKNPVDIMEMHTDLFLAIATTKRGALRYLKTRPEKITEKDIREKIEEKHRTTIEDLKIEKDKLKTELDKVTMDRDRFRDQYNAIIAEHKTQVDIESIRVDRQELDAKSKISDNNVKVSDNKVSESQFKLIHLIGAAAIPVVVGGAIKLLDWYIKSRTNK